MEGRNSMPNKMIESPTFMVTAYAHSQLLSICIDSIKKFYPESRIIISQQINDESEIDIEGTEKIYHDMKTGLWSDVALGLLNACKTDVGIFLEHDAFLLNHLDHYIELIDNGMYDIIGPEDVIPTKGLNRYAPGMVHQSFSILNVKKLKEIGLDCIKFKDGPEYGDCRHKESSYGISQVLDKKLFMPVTPSNYAYGTYYGSEVFHLWYGSFRERYVLGDGVNPRWMEDESSALIQDYYKQEYRVSGIKLPSFNNKRKYAVCLIAHKEVDIIGASIKHWKECVDKVLVLVSTRAWNGNSEGDDGTIRIANELADEVVVGEWKTEAEQRNWGLARLYDYDYVIIADPDEFYTKEDRQKIIATLDKPIHLEYTPDLENTKHVAAFKMGRIRTYWKTPDYEFYPPDKYHMIMAVDPKQVYCNEHRQFKPPYSKYATIDYQPEMDVTCYHMSWVKSDKKVKEKIQSFSHAEDVFTNWYNNVWLKWKPDSDMQVKYRGEEQAIAIYNPAPKEIIRLLK